MARQRRNDVENLKFTARRVHLRTN
jgi:hypothetical protein